MIRRFSQAVSEGDGISVIAAATDAESARAAEAAGAEAILVESGNERRLADIRAATELPILFFFDGQRAADLAGADACVVDVRDRDRARLDAVHAELAPSFEVALRICSDEHLEFVLSEFDPEVLVLGTIGDDEPLAGVLELLPDVPAGKLAIADVGARTGEEVVELERAGVDGVIVATGNVADLVGAAPPEV